jgi:hypothetical protein
VNLLDYEFDSTGPYMVVQELKFVFPNAERINRGGQVSKLMIKAKRLTRG